MSIIKTIVGIVAAIGVLFAGITLIVHKTRRTET